MSFTIRTYRDAVERVIDLFDTEPTERNKRMARYAVQQTYRELPAMARWSYFERNRTLVTSPPYSAGTIAYDHTGGAHERLATITGGVAPDWTASGRLVIGEIRYDVDRHIDNTRFTLTATSNPGADITAGTAYSLERQAYELPADFRRLLQVYDLRRLMPLSLVTPDAIREHSTLRHRTPGDAVMAAVLGTGDNYARVSLLLAPVPQSAVTLDIHYEASPRPLWTEYEATGTVSVDAGSVTVTGTNTKFAATHVGAILRFGANSITAPSDEIGSCIEQGAQPFAYQRRVVEVVSATSLTIDQPIPVAMAGVKYAISDPIDIEPAAMWTAFLRLAEAEFARQIRSEDAPRRRAEALSFTRLALENDSRQAITSSAASNAFSPTITTAP